MLAIAPAIIRLLLRLRVISIMRAITGMRDCMRNGTRPSTCTSTSTRASSITTSTSTITNTITSTNTRLVNRARDITSINTSIL